MIDQDVERLRDIIVKVARSNINSDTWHWLHEKLDLVDITEINAVFSMMPRKTGKELVNFTSSEEQFLNELKPGWSFKNWTADRLCRVCFLMHLDSTDRDKYFRVVENLFLAAEMTELVALYSTLPVLAHPDLWKMRCAEGVRSNMGTVLEAIMYDNPYPAMFLDEQAWNQLVMKAFFTDKDVNRIHGFDERANAELAIILSDYAHERWAAGRKVNPLLWRSTSKFIDSRIRKDLEIVLAKGDVREKQGAALAIYHSDSTEAKELLRGFNELVEEIEKKALTWEMI